MLLATTKVLFASPLFLLSAHTSPELAFTPGATTAPRSGGQFAAAVAVSGGDVLVSSIGLSKFRGVNGVHVFCRTGTKPWTETAVLTPKTARRASASAPR